MSHSKVSRIAIYWSMFPKSFSPAWFDRLDSVDGCSMFFFSIQLDNMSPNCLWFISHSGEKQSHEFFGSKLFVHHKRLTSIFGKCIKNQLIEFYESCSLIALYVGHKSKKRNTLKLKAQYRFWLNVRQIVFHLSFWVKVVNGQNNSVLVFLKWQ